MESQARHIVCPSCGSVNRVPAEKDARAAKCGKCHARLFDRQIEKSDIPVVVDFWAEWCGPCHVMAPIYEQVARELEPRLRFLKLDTEAQPAIAARYNIRGIPTIMVFKHGNVLGQRAGVMERSALRSWLEPLAG